MDIVVHGTKGGRKIFTPKKISGLLDVSSDTSKAAAIGQEAYGIRFTEDYTIYSKYKIIRDVRGDKRTGFVGFSITILKNQKLAGSDIYYILERVSKEYSKYIVDENLNDVTEDWNFLDLVLDEYKNKLINISAENIEIMQSGERDDAYIYFKDDSELQKFFDTPFQEEYSPYRQVLFINTELHDKPENPLNALRHSENDLTAKIDLYNPTYKLLFNQTAKGGMRIDVKVQVNDHYSVRSNRNKIRKKQELKITWSKQYYQTVVKCGKWYEISNEYITVNDTEQTVLINEIDLPQEMKAIVFEIKDSKGDYINNAEIQIGHRPWQTINGSAEISFYGEEIIKQWNVSAKKESEDFYSNPVNVTPVIQNDLVVLTLQKHKKIKFQGEWNNGSNSLFFTDIKITIQTKNVYNHKPEYNFVDSEIHETYKVTATYSSAAVNLKGEKEFCPNDVNLVSIELKKSIQENYKSYALDMGEHGCTLAEYSNSETGHDISVDVITKGYVFRGFRLDRNNKHGSYEGTLVAQYEKQKSFITKAKTYFSKHPVIASSVVILLVLFVVWAMYPFERKDKQTKETPLTSQQITAYVEGNSLLLDTLKNYKNIWEKQKPTFETSGGIVWYNPVTWFVGSNGAKYDSTEYKKWQKSAQSIDSAIRIRNLLTEENIAELKNQKYSPTQQSFKASIDNIDRTNDEEVRQKIGDVSVLTLTQIADSINAILASIEQKEQEQPIEPEQEEMETVAIKGNVTQPVRGESNLTAETKQIEKDLQGATITKQKLNEYSEDKFTRLKESIQLYKKFWTLVNSSTKKDDYNDLLKNVKENNILKNSELKRFLDLICASSDDFKRFNSASGKATCNSIMELKNKIN